MTRPTFFATPADFRAWFEQHHANQTLWSTINVARLKALTEAGLMRPAGLAAFERRKDGRSGVYSYERRTEAKLDAAGDKQFRANKKAWAFFEAQAPWYRRTAFHWVVRAKKEETRQKRLATLISDSATGRTVGPLTRPTRRA